jgi:hypothetical protein
MTSWALYCFAGSRTGSLSAAKETFLSRAGARLVLTVPFGRLYGDARLAGGKNQVHFLRRRRHEGAERGLFRRAFRLREDRFQVRDAGLPAPFLQQDFLVRDGVGEVDLVAAHEIRNSAGTLPGVADDDGGPAAAGAVLEFPQGAEDGLVAAGVDAEDLPAEGRENLVDPAHGVQQVFRLSSWPSFLSIITQKLSSRFRPGVHHRFPQHAFLHFAVSRQREDVEGLAAPGGQGETWATQMPWPRGPSRCGVPAGSGRDGRSEGCRAPGLFQVRFGK